MATPSSSAPQPSASAVGREALLVGINSYANGPLHNCINDATDLGAALERLGFRALVCTDCSLDAFEDALHTFYERLRPGAVGLFFFSGHGCEFQSHNYLLPADWRCGGMDTTLQRRAISAQEVLNGMKARDNGINVVILDACRVYRGVTRSTRDAPQGLVPMLPPDMTDGGTVIAYATAPGAVSFDGDGSGGRNGMYTAHLLRHIAASERLVDMLDEVGFSVRDATARMSAQRQQQVPWVHSTWSDRRAKGFSLAQPTVEPGAHATGSVSPPPPPRPPALPPHQPSEPSMPTPDDERALDALAARVGVATGAALLTSDDVSTEGGALSEAELRGMLALVKRSTSLRKLEASRNDLNDEGAKQIAVALASNEALKLERLYLQGNQIADAGATAIGQALASNGALKLTRLSLSSNQIGDKGATAIGQYLASNGALDVLTLLSSNPGISLSTKDAFQSDRRLHF